MVILAALIAGFFSLLSLIVSKEQKVSEFRQQWIDCLRQEIADHVAAVVSLSAMRETQKGSDEEFVAKTNELQQRVASTFTSIKLRINPDDSDEKIKKLNLAVLRLIDKSRTLFNALEWKNARTNCNEITNAAIPMLKEEWKRVKRGESVYVWSKRIAIALFVLSLGSSVWAAVSFWPSIGETASVQAPVSEEGSQEANAAEPESVENP